MSKKRKKELQQATTHLLAAIKMMSADENLSGNFIALPDILLPNTKDMLMLAIEIGGENQTGSTTLSVIEDAAFKPVFIKGSTEADVPVKSCNSLNENTILIVSEVSDTNKDTANNITTVTITLSVNGVVVYKDHHETTVKSEGDTAKFIYKISCHVE